YDHWIRSCDTLVGRYGIDGMYLLLPDMTEDEAERFLDYAERNWSAPPQK
ncbi:MAG: hypothetical protein GX558_09395, partial [Clostridiales bacterium]|nr:hypothetical protein [Clostridiales bacterium]